VSLGSKKQEGIMKYNKNDIQKRMDQAVEALQKEFSGLRTGRASASLLDPVIVDVYGAKMPLNQVASISVPEPRLLSVQVWDAGSVKAVEKAIRESGLGLNPQTEGSTLRLPIPDLNEERRKELGKVASKYAEQARISVRNIRKDGMDALKHDQKEGDITEDDLKRGQDEVQKLTDDHINKIDTALSDKEKEIMTV